MNNLERARHLRDSAARCMRLSKGVGNQEDEALLEALAAEWDQAAAEIESAAADQFRTIADTVFSRARSASGNDANLQPRNIID